MEFLKESSRGNVMEIGVRQGASTAALLAGVEENGGHLWSIDNKEWWKDCFVGHPQWTFVLADSVKDAHKIKDAIPAFLDLLLIDADHSFASVLSDLENYAGRAKVVALHDADESGVRNAMVNYCINNQLDYTIRNHSFGLGVITR